MKFNVKTTSVAPAPVKNDEMESLVLQMVALCIEKNPEFATKLSEKLEKVTKVA